MAQALEQLFIAPDEGEAFEAAADRLVDAFEAWLAGRGLGLEDGWVAHQLLHVKWGHIDGALTRWTRADLHEALLEVFPRKVVIDPGDAERVVPAVARFVEFLDAEGLLDGDTAGLAAELERIGPAVAEAVCDRSRFGPAKAVFAAMRDDGVDVEDPDEVDAWVAAFNAGLDGGLPGAPRTPVAPVVIADAATLADAAAATPLAGQLAAFVGWVGKGRPLTQAGNPRVADAKALVEVLGTGDVTDPHQRTITSATDLGGVDLVFRVALHARLVRRHGGRLVSTRRGRRVVADSLETWREGVAALLDLGLLGWRARQWRPWWHEPLDSDADELLCALYVAGAADVAALADAALEAISDEYDLDGLPQAQRELLPAGITRGVEALVDRLEWLGMLVWRDAQTVDLAGVPARCGGHVTLTALGDWYTRALLEARGHNAPLADDWVEADVAELLDAAEHWPAERAEAALRHWARQRGDALAEIAASAREAADVTVRVRAVEAAVAVSDDAEAAVRRLRAERALRPAATLWLLAHDRLDADELEPGEVLPVLAEQLAVVLAAAGPDALGAVFDEAEGLLAGAGSSPRDLVAELWRVPGPVTAEVLDALAGCHDKRLAKTARKARFKLRSAS